MKTLAGLGRILGALWAVVGCLIVGVACGYIGNATAMELILTGNLGVVVAFSGALLFGFAGRAL